MYEASCTPINYKSKNSIVRKVKQERQNLLTPGFIVHLADILSVTVSTVPK